jgi:hypothetical protein
MVADGMLTRKRYREVPPRVDYELTERARDLMPVIGALARWGYQWAWSPPRTGERVDVGAILRLAPGVIAGDVTPGEVEMTITDGHREGGPATFTLTTAADGTTVAEQRSERPGARVTGDLATWVRAFAPEPDVAGLTIEGDATMARALLASLAAADESGAATQRDRRVA